MSDQQPWLVSQPKLLNYSINWIDHIYRTRIASTLQVDIYIRDLIELLTKYDEIDNTFIIYSSDHGYHLGEYRIPVEKEQIFETDIHVPYYIRGPGIKQNITISNIVSNIDIYPTILDLAEIEIPDNVDGKSMKGLLNGDMDAASEWREMLLIEIMDVNNQYFNATSTWFSTPNDFHGKLIKPNAGQNTLDPNQELTVYYGDGVNYGNNWRLLRIINETYDWTYAEYYDYHFNQTSFENPYLYVLYDNNKDRYQLNNIYNSITKEIQNELHSNLMTYGQCKASQCP